MTATKKRTTVSCPRQGCSGDVTILRNPDAFEVDEVAVRCQSCGQGFTVHRGGGLSCVTCRCCSETFSTGYGYHFHRIIDHGEDLAVFNGFYPHRQDGDNIRCGYPTEKDDNGRVIDRCSRQVSEPWSPCYQHDEGLPIGVDPREEQE